MKVLGVVVSWKRPENLKLVVGGLRKQSFIDDITILHNAPSSVGVDGVQNVFLSKNYGSRIRHEWAQSLDYDYYVFSDDDVALQIDTSSVVTPNLDPETILGIAGMQVADDKHPYTSGKYVFGIEVDKPHPVDIVLGRFHIISRRGVEAMRLSKFNTEMLLSEDDIRANVTVQYSFGKPSYVLPIHTYVNLPAPHALCGRSYHWRYRNGAVLNAKELGWKLIR